MHFHDFCRIIIIIINLTSMFFQDQSRVWTAASQQHKVDNTHRSTRDFSFNHSDTSISRKFCLVTIRQLSIHRNVGVGFWWRDVLPHTNQLALGKRRWNFRLRTDWYKTDVKPKSFNRIVIKVVIPIKFLKPCEVHIFESPLHWRLKYKDYMCSTKTFVLI